MLERARGRCALTSGYTKYYYAGGDLVAFTRSSGYGQDYGRRYVFKDHLGSTSVIVNGGGTKLWEERFYPYGESRYTYRKDQGGRDIDLQTPMRYTGQRLDEAIGLYYYNARYYDPALGRFAQADTIVPEPGNPRSLNRYSYVGNQPTIYNDPSGNCPWCIAAIGGALVGGGLSWGQQFYANVQTGMSWQDAALTVDVAEIAGSAVAGAIVGGTFGAVGAAGGVAGLGFWSTVGTGAVSNMAAGQASSLIQASVTETIDWLHNRDDFSRIQIIESAKALGFLDTQQLLIDAGSGAVAGGVAYGASAALSKVAQQIGFLDKTLESSPVWTIQFLPDGNLTASTGRSALTIPADVANSYLIIFANEGPERAARWLFNQVRKGAEDYIEDGQDG